MEISLNQPFPSPPLSKNLAHYSWTNSGYVFFPRSFYVLKYMHTNILFKTNTQVMPKAAILQR